MHNLIGYRYAGIVNGKKCSCGDSGYNTYGSSESCNLPCRGGTTLCGGDNSIFVYELCKSQSLTSTLN